VASGYRLRNPGQAERDSHSPSLQFCIFFEIWRAFGKNTRQMRCGSNGRGRMESFTAKSSDKIQGVLSGFDRLIFRGFSPETPSSPLAPYLLVPWKALRNLIVNRRHQMSRELVIDFDIGPHSFLQKQQCRSHNNKSLICSLPLKAICHTAPDRSQIPLRLIGIPTRSPAHQERYTASL
jgi:hypothetical protein